jgi:hypothetical protein
MGLGEVENGYVPNDEVYYLTAERKVEHTPERVIVEFADAPFSINIAEERKSDNTPIGDFSLFFARKYIESGLLKNGRKLLIVRAAIGGTGFKKGNWGINDLLYKKMIEMTDYALSLNKNNRIVAFLWHQGEHDAFEKNTPDNFYKQLSTLISDIRSKYGKTLPFIAADFVNEWKSENIEICEPIVEKIKLITQEKEYAGFIETSDLLSNNQKHGSGDKIHFCRQSLHDLGRRYFTEYKRILGE